LLYRVVLRRSPTAGGASGQIVADSVGTRLRLTESDSDNDVVRVSTRERVGERINERDSEASSVNECDRDEIKDFVGDKIDVGDEDCSVEVDSVNVPSLEGVTVGRRDFDTVRSSVSESVHVASLDCVDDEFHEVDAVRVDDGVQSAVSDALLERLRVIGFVRVL
jgi:hypothetical protein